MIGTKRQPLIDSRQVGVINARSGGRNWMRIVGNFLIVTGLLLMISVGSYLGYQAYSNEQTIERITQEGAVTADVDFLPPVSENSGSHAGSAPVENPASSETTAPAASGSSDQPDSVQENHPLSTGGASSVAAVDPDKVVINNLPLPVLNAGTSGSNYTVSNVSQTPTRLWIPSVSIDSKIEPVGWEMLPGKDGRDAASWMVAEYAVGHHQGTANPGQVGNVVLSGHVDWKGEVFKNLNMVKRGDQVHVYGEDGREYLYIIQDIEIVKEEGADVTDEMRRNNARYMDPTPDQTLTMITCYPYGVDDHRLIVIAKPYDSGLPTRPDLVMK